MIPLSFDSKTAREVAGDERARAIEVKARADADSGKYDPPSIDGVTYWDNVRANMDWVVYRTQYASRLARNERKALSPDHGSRLGAEARQRTQ